jgi:hypothetical protein
MNLALKRTTVIRCPTCHFASEEIMPADACQVRYTCMECGAILCPKPGDCCVFCSYGNTVCPPKQAEASSSSS